MTGHSNGTSRRGRRPFVFVLPAFLLLGVVSVAGLQGGPTDATDDATAFDATARDRALVSTIRHLRTLPFDQIDAGARDFGGVRVRWTSTPDGPDVKSVALVAEPSSRVFRPADGEEPPRTHFLYRALR